MSQTRPVYSTEHGRLCPGCGQPINACQCRKGPAPTGDGIVRVRRETGGRGGKTVTTATGFLLDDEQLKQLAAELKRRCGTGGAVKDRVVEIQGDHRELLKAELEKRGFTVKLAGG
ncbi:translation initiation factor 1 [Chitinivorax tropicus]|uniref:Translation initiation factor 1 n=1 Tax=Chitinivorax tropicus TaxID=714531 RepID=A0A840MWX0_9PROT|nr:translation initiation factor Sui1 [Chitinivorax tropicus]MBB5019661.1 translation initiation factor 1 [Chitinivorax tropicus]